MEAAPEGDERGPSGGNLRELHRRLDRLGSGVRQEEPVVDPGPGVREALGEPPMELEPRLVIDDVLLEVDPARRLGADRLDHSRMRVTGVRDTDAARVVEVTLAVGRLNP